MRLRLAVEFAPRDAALGAGACARTGSDVDAFRERVDRASDPPSHTASAGDVVTAAADSELKAVRTGEFHGVDDVGGTQTTQSAQACGRSCHCEFFGHRRIRILSGRSSTPENLWTNRLCLLDRVKA